MDFVANDMKFDYFIIKQWGGRFKVWGSGFRIQDSGFRVQGSGLWWRLRRNIYGAMPA